MTNEEMNWFLRGGKRPEPVPEAKAPVVCQNCGGDNLADERPDPAVEFVMEKLASHRARPKIDAPINDGPTSKEYLVRVSQVKKCLWEGYVEVAAGSKCEALAKAMEEFEHCGLDSWDLVDPELGSEDGSDDEPVFSIEPEA